MAEYEYVCKRDVGGDSCVCLVQSQYLLRNGNISRCFLIWRLKRLSLDDTFYQLDIDLADTRYISCMECLSLHL